MTSFAIMSDPHGNLEALTRVFRDVDSRGVDEVFCLGDVVGYGPQPQECAALLRERSVTLVMGNHEQGLLNSHYLRRFNQPACDALLKTREMLTEGMHAWLVSRPKAAVAHGCRFVHGTPPDDVNEYIWKYEKTMGGIFARFSEDVCFVGHTHDLMRFTFGQEASGRLPLPEGDTTLEQGMRHVVNVGSVGQPRDGDNRAKYALYDPDSRILTMRFVEYDIRKTADLIIKHGFHRAFADRLW